MNFLTSWKFYKEKEGYLEKLSKNVIDTLMHVIGMDRIKQNIIISIKFIKFI